MSILEIKNLTKQYGDFKAIDSVSFEAYEGEIFGLLGPNGAGKTTTIRTIATILGPTSGSGKVLGFDIVENAEKVRQNIGVLTTEIGIYGRFSGRENLAYFGELYGIEDDKLKARIEALSRLLVMEEFIDRKAGEYSTGMKQKLAIARSVIHDPKVIIFDEPTSGLDVLAAQTVLNFMKKAKEMKKCVIFSTHQMSDAERLCDRTAIIHKGRIVFNDSVSRLKQQTGQANLEDAFMKLVNMEGVGL